jgi:starch phosphorylase
MPEFPTATLPEEVTALDDLALDLRWTWSHEADSLWQRVDAEAWALTRNPWGILREISSDRQNESILH